MILFVGQYLCFEKIVHLSGALEQSSLKSIYNLFLWPIVVIYSDICVFIRRLRRLLSSPSSHAFETIHPKEMPFLRVAIVRKASEGRGHWLSGLAVDHSAGWTGPGLNLPPKGKILPRHHHLAPDGRQLSVHNVLGNVGM